MAIVLKSPTREKLETKLQKLARLQSEIKRLEQSEKTAARKLETRKKVVIGAAALKAVDAGKLSENWIQNLVMSFASERDKAIFDFAKTDSENGNVNGVVSAQRE
ncbi:hypothetical protein [Brucella intermedia]|uniref:hypothetical protein n=1 Tax=Brucella intermedia TaxID=94625 RepID=UPI000EFCCA6D|nr:hypothetical protein [Brucella intermedia]KAB2720379.1 hypothetical protein F9K75_04725 [Brucella intermedia]